MSAETTSMQHAIADFGSISVYRAPAGTYRNVYCSKDLLYRKIDHS